MGKEYTKPWIKLWKKSMENPIYQNGKPFDEWHAWQDLLLLCDNKGTFKTTLKWLKTRWNWKSTKVVRTYLGTLKGTFMIDTQGTFGRNGGITIKVLKYWAYQGPANASKSKRGHIKNGDTGHIKGQVEVLNTEESKGLSQSSVPTLSDVDDDFDITKGEFDD